MSVEPRTKRFRAELVREYSALPTPEPLGLFENVMQWFPNDRGTGGQIEWSFWPVGGFEDGCEVEHIGVIVKAGRVTDYDGVMSLPKEAADFLRELGFDTTEVE